jgi:hypothetical protein
MFELEVVEPDRRQRYDARHAMIALPLLYRTSPHGGYHTAILQTVRAGERVGRLCIVCI